MIYVTGANGWLGLNLVHEITKRPEIFMESDDKDIQALILPGSDKSKIKAINENVNIFEGDLIDKTSLEKFLQKCEGGTLIHSAGVIHPKKVKDFFQINFKGTRNLLRVAHENRIKKVVVISSNSPFGFNISDTHLFDEKSRYKPYMNYGKSKMMMEKFVADFQRRTNLDITIIRAPWFYGPFQPDRQKRFFEMIRKGSFPKVGNGNNKRSMVYTKNLCLGISLSIKRGISKGKVYWIADPHPYSMNEIVRTIEEVFEKKLGITCKKTKIRLPNFVSEVARAIDFSIQSIGLYNQEFHVLSEMNKNICCSISLAEKELSYTPKLFLKHGIEESLLEIYNN